MRRVCSDAAVPAVNICYPLQNERHLVGIFCKGAGSNFKTPFAPAESAAEALDALADLIREKQDQNGRDWIARSDNVIKLQEEFAQAVYHLDANDAQSLDEGGAGEVRKRVTRAR
jgi:hypothetical protein